jgi:membrane-bound lytic murein transglycosylase B
MTHARYSLMFVLLAGLSAAPAWAAEPDFAAWREAFRAEAAQAGINAPTLAALDTLTPDARVVRLDQSQPEKRRTFAQYQDSVVSAERKQRARALYRQHRPLLVRIEQRSGVPAAVIVALWGIESSFGTQQGDFSVLRSLMTLAYEGRRATYFRKELLAALKIIQQGDRSVENLRGSWAGAMGQCQFMPSTYLAYAADGNGDQRRDIWQNTADVLASIAQYLQSEGWAAGRVWGQAVQASAVLPDDAVGLKDAQGQVAARWRELGLTASDGAALADGDGGPLYLVQPDGAKGDSFLVTENYRAIMRWNRSTYFATAVGLLADAIAE